MRSARARRSSAHSRGDLHRLVRGRPADRAAAAGRSLSAALHRRDGRQERLHRHRRAPISSGPRRGIMRSAFGMGGQKCSALSRLYVDRQVAEPLIERLLGSSPRSRSAIRRAARTGWARSRPRAGYDDYARYAATAARAAARACSPAASNCGTVTWRAASSCSRRWPRRRPEHPLWQQEMFLPILMLHRVADNEEAMRLANASPLGLTAGFYGASDEIPWFQEHIEAGVTYANRPQGATTGAWPGYQPFGGWKGSGTHRQGHRLLLLSAPVPARAVADHGRVIACACAAAGGDRGLRAATGRAWRSRGSPTSFPSRPGTRSSASDGAGCT